MLTEFTGSFPFVKYLDESVRKTIEKPGIHGKLWPGRDSMGVRLGRGPAGKSGKTFLKSNLRQGAAARGGDGPAAANQRLLGGEFEERRDA